MKFIYQSEGAESPDWIIELDMSRPRLTAGEAVWLERHNGSDKTGLRPLSDVMEACGAGELTAMLSVLFVYRKRQEPTLRYQEFEDSIVTDDLSVELTKEEMREAGMDVDEDEDGPKDEEPNEASEESEPSPSTD